MNSKKHIAIYDWDGTLRDGFTIFDWTRFLTSKFKQRKYYTEIIQEYNKYKNKKLTHDEFCNKSALIYSSLLMNKSVEEVSEMAFQFIKNDKNKLLPDILLLIYFFKLRNIEQFILSGAPFEILNIYATIFGLEIIGSLELQTQNGIYTGQIKQNSGLAEEKEKKVKKIIKKNHILFAFGNSTSDYSFLEKSVVPFYRGRVEKGKKFISVSKNNYLKKLIETYGNN